MTIGSILVGIAVLAVVGAYLVRPFRPSSAMSLDRTIEAWVAQVKEERERPEDTKEAGVATVEGATGHEMNYCPHCGRQVDPDDRFCSGCGKQLLRRTG